MRKGLIFSCCFAWTMVHAQQSFDHYVPLQSKGEVPTDFSQSTRQKINADDRGPREGLTAKEQRVFIEEVNYTIDGLLYSGLVTYGDPVSHYIQKIGDRLTKGQEGLEGVLRFYTLNSNEANAFSTDQGMVFVTTGLIAQMTNEAQLAFVLAHEIIHYREEHVLDLYDYVSENKSLSYAEKIRFFSKYSRDNEFEADREGVKLYHAAGYTSTEISRTFDVLIYSYLPFEEIPLDKDYFNNENLFIPEKYFKLPKSEITASQSYDDRLNSHPNIAKRIESIDEAIAAHADWGTVFHYDEAEFFEVRNICRFEYVLNDVYSGTPINALFDIYLLEREYPDSRFLKECKSQVWLELMKSRQTEMYGMFDFSDFEGYESDYEGEISRLDQVLGRIPMEGKVALSLRIIRDEWESDSLDPTLRKMWDKSIELAASNDAFELNRYSKNTFSEAIRLQEEAKKAAAADTARQSRPKWDKYETIRNQKTGLTIDEGIDSSKFYLYAISDLVADSVFLKRFGHYKELSREREQEDEDFFILTDDEQQEIGEEELAKKLHLGVDTLLMVNPFVYEGSGDGGIRYTKSEELEVRLLTAVRNMSEELGMTVKTLDRADLTTITTKQYNDLATVMRSLEKGVFTSGTDVFLLDQVRLDSLRATYGSSKVMLLTLDHTYDSPFRFGPIALSILLPPVGLLYLPTAVLSGHKTELNVYIMDLEKGEIAVERSFVTNDPATLKLLELRLYALFHQLNQEPADAQD